MTFTGLGILVLLLGTILFPYHVIANGGPQYYVDGYVVAMSQSPFVPGAGETTNFLFSFVDSETYNPAKELIDINIDISDRFDNIIFEGYEAQATDGYHEFSYAFPEDGIYHINVNFTVAGEQSRSSHFLLGVKSQVDGVSTRKLLLASGFTLLLGLILGFSVTKLRK